MRPRVLLSRELSLYFNLDFTRIPAAKRSQALQQQLVLVSPFIAFGHYAHWQDGRAHLWIWDQAALEARLPQASRHAVLPDSALSLAEAPSDGERLIAGVSGYEWQRWRNGQLLDSRWLATAAPGQPANTLDLTQRSPMQAADRQTLQQIVIGIFAAALLAGLLIQAGAWLSLDREVQTAREQLANLDEGNQLQAQARRRAMQNLDLWQTRQSLFAGSQCELIARIGEALPDSASLWQRYDYQPGRLQIFLQDADPDPRDYVTRLNATGLVNNIQVQPEPRNDMVTLQATPTIDRAAP